MSSSNVQRRRSWEFAAIPVAIVVLGVLAVIMWAFTAGLWMWLTVGVVALIALVAVLVAGVRRPGRPNAASAPSLPDSAVQRADDGVRRVLVIADEACAPDDLGAALEQGASGGATAVFVIAPALGSRMGRWTADEKAYHAASEHLAATLDALASLSIEADGHVGSHDPLQAADDGLREFPAEEIVFVVHQTSEANWLEERVADMARTRYPIPVRELVVARP
jgi:hypothetical protein